MNRPTTNNEVVAAGQHLHIDISKQFLYVASPLPLSASVMHLPQF